MHTRLTLLRQQDSTGHLRPRLLFAFRCSNQTNSTDGPLWAYNYCPTSYSWIVLTGLLLYLAFFAPGVMRLLGGGKHKKNLLGD